MCSKKKANIYHLLEQIKTDTINKFYELDWTALKFLIFSFFY
jgi:hypothetical protein